MTENPHKLLNMHPFALWLFVNRFFLSPFSSGSPPWLKIKREKKTWSDSISETLLSKMDAFSSHFLLYCNMCNLICIVGKMCQNWKNNIFASKYIFFKWNGYNLVFANQNHNYFFFEYILLTVQLLIKSLYTEEMLEYITTMKILKIWITFLGIGWRMTTQVWLDHKLKICKCEKSVVQWNGEELYNKITVNIYKLHDRFFLS